LIDSGAGNGALSSAPFFDDMAAANVAEVPRIVRNRVVAQLPTSVTPIRKCLNIRANTNVANAEVCT